MNNKNIAIGSALLFMVLLASGTASASDGGATFESFYRSDYSVNWALAGFSAALIGVLVIIGWLIVAPSMVAAIGYIGGAVGSLFGLTGIAATNAGLALLGGGAIATGGFGIIGGTALLATALTFGTEVTIDYTTGSLMSAYESNRFATASLSMVTLPPPVNTQGPDSVKAAGKALESTTTSDYWKCAKRFPENVDQFKGCLASIQIPQRQLIKNALVEMDANRSSTSASDLEREAAMYALLYFLNIDYVAAKKSSLQSYQLGIKANHKPTLPAFIYASSLLYDDKPNLAESFEFLKYSINAERNNVLTPVLFSAYLDRLSYRLNDGAASIDQMDRLSKLANGLADDERKLAIQQTLLSHYVMQLKLAQQKIISLTGTPNIVIRENPKTVSVIRASLRDYGLLVAAGNELVVRQNSLLKILAQNPPLLNRMNFGNNPFTDTSNGWPKALLQFSEVLAAYQKDQGSMEARVTTFEKEVADAQAAKLVEVPEAKKSGSLIDWIKGLFK